MISTLHQSEREHLRSPNSMNYATINAGYDTIRSLDGIRRDEGFGASFEGNQEAKDPEKPEEEETKVFKSRFWILALFSFLSLFHVIQWNSWSPICESAIAAFPGWDASTVAMLANLGLMSFVVFIVPICWLNERYGLRFSVLTCAFLMAAGSLLRCIFINTETFTILAHIGAILVGIPGTLVLAAPSAIAATWFPPHERITATAFSQVLCQLGGVGSFLEPLLVRSPGPDVTTAELRSDIMRLMYIGGGVGVAVLVAAVVYFPAHPPLPPSISSSVERLNLVPSMKAIIKNPSVWLMMISYGFNEGVCVMWMSVLNFSLLQLDIHMDQAMWIGITGILASSVGALVSGRLTDKAFGRMKASIIALEFGALGCYCWFLLLTLGMIKVTMWQVYTSVALGMTFSYAAVPLYFELTVELAFPCPEVVLGAFLAMGENMVGMVFLLLFFIKDIGYTWVIATLVTASASSILPLIFVKEVYKRSNLDRHSSNTSVLQINNPD